MRCQKIVYADDFNSEGVPVRSRCLKGLILDDTDPDFISFKTAKNNYKINKKFVISISPTNDEFKECDYYEL